MSVSVDTQIYTKYQTSDLAKSYGKAHWGLCTDQNQKHPHIVFNSIIDVPKFTFDQHELLFNQFQISVFGSPVQSRTEIAKIAEKIWRLYDNTKLLVTPENTLEDTNYTILSIIRRDSRILLDSDNKSWYAVITFDIISEKS